MKVTKYLKAVEIKILDLFFWTKKSYRNITNTKLSNNFFAKKDFFSYLFFFSRTFAIFSGVFFNFVFWVASGFLKINVAAWHLLDFRSLWLTIKLKRNVEGLHWYFLLFINIIIFINLSLSLLTFLSISISNKECDAAGK